MGYCPWPRFQCDSRETLPKRRGKSQWQTAPPCHLRRRSLSERVQGEVHASGHCQKQWRFWWQAINYVGAGSFMILVSKKWNDGPAIQLMEKHASMTDIQEECSWDHTQPEGPEGWEHTLGCTHAGGTRHGADMRKFPKSYTDNQQTAEALLPQRVYTHTKTKHLVNNQPF